jgi:hypothetical protein
MYAHKTTQQYTTEKISPFPKWAKNTTEEKSYFMHTHAEQIHAVYCRPGRAHEPTTLCKPTHIPTSCTHTSYMHKLRIPIFRGIIGFFADPDPGKNLNADSDPDYIKC